MQPALPLVLSLLTALPAKATPPAPEPLPWGRGTLMPSFALGGSLLLDQPGTTLQVAGGLGYYVIDNLAVGLSLRNRSRFLGAEVKSSYPGVETQVATNEFSVTPGLTVMLHRGRIVSPILGLGAGPLVMNNRLGVIGEVVLTPAMLVRVHPRVALDLGFEVSIRFPRARTRGTYDHPSVDYTVYFPNALHLGFHVGVAFGPKVGRYRRAAPTTIPGTDSGTESTTATTTKTATESTTATATESTTASATESTTTTGTVPATAPTTVTPPGGVAPNGPGSGSPGPGPAPGGPPNGRGLLSGGAVATFAAVPMTLVGLRLTLAGAFSEGQDTPGADFGAPLMIGGVVALVAGVTALGVGGHRFRRWRAWERARELSLRPHLQHRGAATSVGLTLRF